MNLFSSIRSSSNTSRSNTRSSRRFSSRRSTRDGRYGSGGGGDCGSNGRSRTGDDISIGPDLVGVSTDALVGLRTVGSVVETLVATGGPEW